MNPAALDATRIDTPPAGTSGGSDTLEGFDHASPQATDPAGNRLISGKRVIALVAVICLLTLSLNVVMARRNRTADRLRVVSEAQINDTARTRQVWTPEADGMKAAFTSIANTADEVKRIRHDMRLRRLEYLRADYSDPKFGKEQIPGRAVLEFGTANKQLNCRYRDIPGGGELRWITTDSVMLDSLKDWAMVVSSSGFAGAGVAGAAGAGVAGAAGAGVAGAAVSAR